MSVSADDGSESINTSSTVKNYIDPKTGNNISEPLSTGTLYYAEDSLTESCSSLSTIPDDNLTTSRTYENDDSDYSDYDSDNSFQEFKLKDWLKLAKTLVRKQETEENKSKLLSKYDELQDFFYFFAVEYFTGDVNVEEFVTSKRNEFVMAWQDVVTSCDFIFDLLLDRIGDINVENSFRL